MNNTDEYEYMNTLLTSPSTTQSEVLALAVLLEPLIAIDAEKTAEWLKQEEEGNDTTT